MGETRIQIVPGEFAGVEQLGNLGHVTRPGGLGQGLRFFAYIIFLISPAGHGFDHVGELGPVFAPVFAGESVLGFRELELGTLTDPALGLLLQVLKAGVDGEAFARGRLVHDEPFLLEACGPQHQARNGSSEVNFQAG